MFSWLLAATPVWLSLLLIAACSTLALRLWLLVRRVDRHARSIAHMDEWADSVDHQLRKIETRASRPPPVAAPPRELAGTPKWWQK
jgi:hypothetical protein